MLLFFSCQELVNNDQQRALTSRTPPRESSKSPTRAVSWVNRLFCSETDCTQLSLKKRHRLYVTLMTDLSDPTRPQILAVERGRDTTATLKCLGRLTQDNANRSAPIGSTWGRLIRRRAP